MVDFDGIYKVNLGEDRYFIFSRHDQIDHAERAILGEYHIFDWIFSPAWLVADQKTFDEIISIVETTPCGEMYIDDGTVVVPDNSTTVEMIGAPDAPLGIFWRYVDIDWWEIEPCND